MINAAIHLRQRRGQQAFTLVEMLVVLLIVGMTTTLLFQMLSQTIRVQRYAGIQIADAQQGMMETDWFRQVINGLQPDYQGADNVFQGGARRLAGLSTNPLTSNYGAAIPIELTLAFDSEHDLTRLFYGPAINGTLLMAWPHDIGRFTYIDVSGDSHDVWPPPFGLWPQLPQAIRLDFEREGTPRVIVATPRGPLETPLLRPSDLFRTGQPT